MITADKASGVQVRLTIGPRYEQEPVSEPITNGPGADRRLDARPPGSIRTTPVHPRKLGHVVIGSTTIT